MGHGRRRCKEEHRGRRDALAAGRRSWRRERRRPLPLRCLRSLRQEAKEQRNGVCVCVRAYEGKGERSEMERGRENGWERTRNERCFWCMRERERERSNPAHSCVRICVYICVCVCVCVRGGVRWWESERERGVKRVSTIAVTRSPLSFSLFLHLDPPPLSAIPFPPAALILLPHTHTHTHTQRHRHTRAAVLVSSFIFQFSSAVAAEAERQA